MKVFFFDTETTGTMPGYDRIIQFGGIFGKLNEEDWNFEEQYRVNQLINIDIAIPKEATAIHGLRNEDLQGYDYIDKYIYKFIALCLEADYVVGHNISFDRDMLLGEAKRLGIPFDVNKIKRICTMKPCATLVNGLGGRWPKLKALHEFLFGKGFDGAHNAIADIEATKNCFIELCKSYNFYEHGIFKETLRVGNKVETEVDTLKLCHELLDKLSVSSVYREIAREKWHSNSEALKLLLTLENGKKSVFLTGKAGTGKSTLMKGIISSCEKRDLHPIILGSTGISALNIGGQTIHSFYAMGKDSLYYKDDAKLRKVRLGKDKVELLKQAPFIIIDEISMVHSNTIDVIDRVMRNYLRENRPFGGKQMLFVGDIYQLPPVCTQSWIEEFSDKYKSEWFFHSDVFKTLQYDVIQLRINYRQGDDKQLSKILDDIRDAKISDEDITLLDNCRYNDVDEDATVLFTHRKDVVHHNEVMLDKLSGETYELISETWKEFPDNMKPNNEEIQLKVGAKVMMITNDQKGRWVNGSIGIVKAIDLVSPKPTIIVDINGDEVEVEKYLWRYAPLRMNDKGKWEEKTLGTYQQFPLQLAYAITIHKSQGLTFEECIMNIENVFVGGQAYTALSRVKSLVGLRILGRVNQSKLYFDYRVESFKQMCDINSLWDKIIQYLPHPELCSTYTKVNYLDEVGILQISCYGYFDILKQDIEKFFNAILKKYKELLRKEDLEIAIVEGKRDEIELLPVGGVGGFGAVDKLVIKPVEEGVKLDDATLLKHLKSLRIKLAKQEGFGFKIYMVCSNESLELIAKYKPCNEEQLKLIKGFGDTKVEKYGEYFIQTVLNAGYKEDEFDSVNTGDLVKKKTKTKTSGINEKNIKTVENTITQQVDVASKAHLAVKIGSMSSGDRKLFEMLNILRGKLGYHDLSDDDLFILVEEKPFREEMFNEVLGGKTIQGIERYCEDIEKFLNEDL